MSRFNWAPTVYRMLNGVLCVFKPEGECVHRIVNIIKGNLARDLNALPCYNYEIPLRNMGATVPPNDEAMSLSIQNQANGITDWLEHKLILGERYEVGDFNIRFIDGMSRHSSGVLLMGIGNHGTTGVQMIALSKFLRVYHVKGRLGWATDNFSPKGKIIERTSFNHVTQSKLEKICAAAQAAHTRQMYIYSGISPDSQEAYELASSGIIRPAHRNTPSILYGIKCIHFQPPDFTLEIHSINENSLFLMRLIHDMAIRMKTTAVCTGIRRLRYGHFDLNRALVRQEWTLENIIDNIDRSEELLTPERLFVGVSAEHVELLPSTKNIALLRDSHGIIEEDSNTVEQHSTT